VVSSEVDPAHPMSTKFAKLQRSRFSSLFGHFSTCQHGETTRLCILDCYVDFERGRWNFNNFQEWTTLCKDDFVAVSDSVPNPPHHHQLFKAGRPSLHGKWCSTESCATVSTSSSFNYHKFFAALEWTILTFDVYFTLVLSFVALWHCFCRLIMCVLQVCDHGFYAITANICVDCLRLLIPVSSFREFWLLTHRLRNELLPVF